MTAAVNLCACVGGEWWAASRFFFLHECMLDGDFLFISSRAVGCYLQRFERGVPMFVGTVKDQNKLAFARDEYHDAARLWRFFLASHCGHVPYPDGSSHPGCSVWPMMLPEQSDSYLRQGPLGVTMNSTDLILV